MISDTLSEAVAAIDEYLEHPGTAGCYVGQVREDIVRVRNEMERLRMLLDAPPDLGGE